MFKEPATCQLLILRTGTTVVAVWIYADASTRREKACYLDVTGIHKSNKVVHDDVDTIFMKRAMIAETEKIEFETLALYHLHIGNIIYLYGGKIGLPGNGTKTGKLGTIETHPIIAPGMFVGKCLQDLRSIVVRIFGFLPQQREVFGLTAFSGHIYFFFSCRFNKASGQVSAMPSRPYRWYMPQR